MARRRRAIIGDAAFVAIGARADAPNVVVVNEQFEFALVLSRGDVQRQHAWISSVQGGESGEIRGHGFYGDDRRVWVDAQELFGPCPSLAPTSMRVTVSEESKKRSKRTKSSCQRGRVNASLMNSLSILLPRRRARKSSRKIYVLTKTAFA